MSAPRRTLIFSTALAGATLLALTGCTGADSGDAPEASMPVATVTVAPAESASPTPTPEAAPLVLPDCDTMYPTGMDEYLQFEARHSGSDINPPQEIGLGFFNSTAGPVGQETISQALQIAGCVYPLAYDVATFIWVAELPAVRQQPLIEALKVDPVIESFQTDSGAHVFSYEIETEGPLLGAHLQYVFSGDIVVILVDGFYSRTLTEDSVREVLQPIEELNPGLHL